MLVSKQQSLLRFVFNLCIFSCRKAIPAKAEVVHTCTLSARKSGDREILVNFSADQLAGVTGEAVVYVSYPA